MASTLILLYALNASTAIPTGCFVAAWVLYFIQCVCGIIKFLCNKFSDSD